MAWLAMRAPAIFTKSPKLDQALPATEHSSVSSVTSPNFTCPESREGCIQHLRHHSAPAFSESPRIIRFIIVKFNPTNGQSWPFGQTKFPPTLWITFLCSTHGRPMQHTLSGWTRRIHLAGLSSQWSYIRIWSDMCTALTFSSFIRSSSLFLR